MSVTKKNLQLAIDLVREHKIRHIVISELKKLNLYQSNRGYEYLYESALEKIAKEEHRSIESKIVEIENEINYGIDKSLEADNLKCYNAILQTKIKILEIQLENQRLKIDNNSTNRIVVEVIKNDNN